MYKFLRQSWKKIRKFSGSSGPMVDSTLHANDDDDALNKANDILQSVALYYNITAEYNAFIRLHLPGVYCVPGAENPFEWFGVLFLRQGPYQGGIFRFKLGVPFNFPSNVQCKIIFDLPIFHPLVDPNDSSVDASLAFENLSQDEKKVYQALIYTQKIFFQVEIEKAVNTDAAILFKQNPADYAEKVLDSVKLSREVVYDPIETNDLHAIRFTPWDQSVHSSIRDSMLKREESNGKICTVTPDARTSGLSFMESNLARPKK